MNEEQLKARYRELCVKMHPDRNTENPNATAEFQEMQQQYEERKAELAGDYTKARKGRERREREAKERQERERKERERRKVEMVVEQARLNRQKNHKELKEGDYIYARLIKNSTTIWDIKQMVDVLLSMAVKNGLNDECVVCIEKIVYIGDDEQFMNTRFSDALPEGIWGGWEILQTADPASGIKRSKRVAKVVMFRSQSYCVFGNPQGDPIISDYYLPVNYETMYMMKLDLLRAKIEFEQREAARLEAERKARLLAEIKPLIDEWEPKLIGLSAGLTPKEAQTVALENVKTMLKGKFPGTTFKVKANKYMSVSVFHTLQWEDGPTVEEVEQVLRLFDHHKDGVTPWMERFGSFHMSETDRKLSVLTKAKILQQLGQVSEAFRSRGIDDDVELDEMDWMMLHLMVGVDINAEDAKLCMSTLTAEGKHMVKVLAAVMFIFRNTSYKKATKKTSKR